MAATTTKTGKELKKSGIIIYTVIWQCSNLQIKLPPCSNPLIRNSLGGTPSLNQLSLAQTGNRVAVYRGELLGGHTLFARCAYPLIIYCI